MPADDLQIEGLGDLPEEARLAEGGGAPRTASYWAVWNSCAPDNKAEDAATNGGREAGWILLDDVVADPGIQIGDYTLTSCEDGFYLLEQRNREGTPVEDPIYGLAAQLLTAELNLNAGAETCPIAEEAVIGGHLILADTGFNGAGGYVGAISEETLDGITTFVALLKAYNTGELCH
jgi:hypothetical protein